MRCPFPNFGREPIERRPWSAPNYRQAGLLTLGAARVWGHPPGRHHMVGVPFTAEIDQLPGRVVVGEVAFAPYRPWDILGGHPPRRHHAGLGTPTVAHRISAWGECLGGHPPLPTASASAPANWSLAAAHSTSGPAPWSSCAWAALARVPGAIAQSIQSSSQRAFSSAIADLRLELVVIVCVSRMV